MAGGTGSTRRRVGGTFDGSSPTSERAPRGGKDRQRDYRARRVGDPIAPIAGAAEIRLRQLVDPTIVVAHKDGHITVDISRRVHFESDDATLPVEECKALTPIAKALIEYKMTRIVADVSATGADEAALKSARTRAAAITQCLTDAGVAARRLSSRQVAMSSSEPRTVLRIEPIVK